MNFDEDVVISGGTPVIQLTIGSNTQEATLVDDGDSDASTLKFSYTVRAATSDLDDNGIQWGGAIVSKGATLTGAHGNSIALDITPGDSSSSIALAGVHVNNVTVTPPGDSIYQTGEKLDFVVNFNKAVTVAGGGVPYLNLIIGEHTRPATYDSTDHDSNAKTLKFSYTVQGSDLDTDGIQLASGPINLPPGTTVQATGDNSVIPLTTFREIHYSDINVNEPRYTIFFEQDKCRVLIMLVHS